jgi:hypothetical protein
MTTRTVPAHPYIETVAIIATLLLTWVWIVS